MARLATAAAAAAAVCVLWLACVAVAVLAHNEPHPLDAIKPEAITIALDADIKLVASPHLLQRSGEHVTLTFHGVHKPTKHDWIGVYTSGNVDVTRHVPVKYEMCEKDPSYLSTGNGKLRFKIINMRDSYVMALFRNGTTHGVLAAKSNHIYFANYNEPLQAHLALTGKPSEMKVTWVTKNFTHPQVKWSTASKQYTSSAPASSTTYTVNQMCGEPANHTGWHNPGQFHTAVMTDLLPNTRYYYVYGDTQAGAGFSDEHTFMTGPPVGADQKLDFFVFGDLGQVDDDGSKEHQTVMPASLNTTTSLAKDLVDQRVLFHIGDISYARGYMTQWDNFFEQILPIASRIPWMTCPGNHERDWIHSGSVFEGADSGGECGVAYSTRMQMPRPAFDQTWWSIEMGPIHYVSISTEHPFAHGSVQRAWIEKDLASVDRKRTPWVILGGHRPMYIDSTSQDQPAGDQPVAHELRESFEPLFQKYEVDVAFWGHHHSYQRTCAVLNETCTAPHFGTVHVVTGAAGAKNSRNLIDPRPAHFLYADDMNHGYTRASATGTTLRLQYVTGADRAVMDDVTLQLPAHRLR